MAESNSKLPAPLQKFAKDLRETLIRTETAIREMRAREASTKERKLEKHELCPLCGGPDVNGRCKCIETLQKNALMGYGGGGTGGGGSSQDPAGMGGGGTQPMGMSEKMGKAEMCKACGYEHVYGKHKDPDGDGDHDEDGHDEYVEHHNNVKQGASPLEKKTPEGISEKTMHKLKDEYGHDKEGKAKAYATANAIANGTVNHKSELEKAEDEKKPKKGTCEVCGGKGGKHESRLIGGLVLDCRNDPKKLNKAAPPTSVAQANKEMGGFQSIAHDPIHAGGAKTLVTPSIHSSGGHMSPPGRRTIGSMGRNFASVSGTVGGPAIAKGPVVKSDKNYGSARSPYGTGAAGHASQKNMPSNLKANMAPTAKAEMSTKYQAKVGITGSNNPKAKAAYGDGPHDQRPAMHQADMGRMNSASFDPPKVKKDELPVVNAEPTKAVEGAKMPKAGKKVDAKKTGSGGQLRKDTAAMAKAPPGKGVPGKQPVGQGGGDAHKLPGAAKLPPPGGTKGTAAGTKPVPAGPKPAPAGPNTLRRAGSAEVGRMIGDKGAEAAAAKAPLPSTDVDVSDFDQGPAKPQSRLAPFRNEDGSVDQNGGAKMMQQPGGPAVKKAPMSVDKAVAQMKGGQQQAGGVGFLRGLFSMFHNKQPQGQPTGRGMRPMPQVSVDQAVRKLGGNNGATTIPTDSTGGVQTLPAGTPTGQLKRAPMSRFHGALPLQRSEAAWTLGICVLCRGAEHSGNCN